MLLVTTIVIVCRFADGDHQVAPRVRSAGDAGVPDTFAILAGCVARLLILNVHSARLAIFRFFIQGSRRYEAAKLFGILIGKIQKHCKENNTTFPLVSFSNYDITHL